MKNAWIRETNDMYVKLICFAAGVALAVIATYVTAQTWSADPNEVDENRPAVVVDEIPVARIEPIPSETTEKAPKRARPVTLTDANFAEQVLKSSTPVIVDFWAAWCGPCRAMAPILDQTAAAFGDDVLVGKLNVDENPGVAGALEIEALPTLLIFKDGRVVDEIVGIVSQAEIAQRLQVFVNQSAR